jgi:hypothetical protein
MREKGQASKQRCSHTRTARSLTRIHHSQGKRGACTHRTQKIMTAEAATTMLLRNQAADMTTALG